MLRHGPNIVCAAKWLACVLARVPTLLPPTSRAEGFSKAKKPREPAEQPYMQGAAHSLGCRPPPPRLTGSDSTKLARTVVSHHAEKKGREHDAVPHIHW